MQAKPGWVLTFATAWLVLSMIMALSPPIDGTGRASFSQPAGWLSALVAAALIVSQIRAIVSSPDAYSAKARHERKVAQRSQSRNPTSLWVGSLVMPPLGVLLIIWGIDEHNSGLWALGGTIILGGIVAALLARMIS